MYRIVKRLIETLRGAKTQPRRQSRRDSLGVEVLEQREVLSNGSPFPSGPSQVFNIQMQARALAGAAPFGLAYNNPGFGLGNPNLYTNVYKPLSAQGNQQLNSLLGGLDATFGIQAGPQAIASLGNNGAGYLSGFQQQQKLPAGIPTFSVSPYHPTLNNLDSNLTQSQVPWANLLPKGFQNAPAGPSFGNPYYSPSSGFGMPMQTPYGIPTFSVQVGQPNNGWNLAQAISHMTG
jgi:hypothetical protein